MSVSLVIPAYNCAGTIAETVAEVVAYLESLETDSELLIVDDGSRDGTAGVAREALRGTSDARVIECDGNHGKGGAVRTGMLQAHGDYCIFTDADLAYPPTEIDKVLDVLRQGSDIAVATRVAQESRFTMSPDLFRYGYTRHLGSRFFNWIVRTTLSLSTQDAQAGLKGFSRHAAETIFPRQTVCGFTFDVELFVIAACHGLHVREVPVHYLYFFEPSTIDFARDSVRALFDIVRIYAKRSRGAYR